MGESLVERSTAVEKMDESFNSIGGMEVSVSFGRFENDVLSWEKWSSFSPNKYLEEVGSLSTPGSVAQKKAYFEAHYKKISALKSEESEQEMSMNPHTPTLDESSNDGNYVESSCGNHAEIGLSNGHESVDAEHAYSTDANFSDEGKCDELDSSKGGDDIVAEHETSSSVAEAKDESKIDGVNLEPNVGLESASCEAKFEVDSDKPPKKDSCLTMEKPPSMKNGAKQSIPKSNPKGVTEKIISSKKGTNSTAIKPLPSSTPKHLKKAPAPTPMAASHSKPLMKRENGSSVTKSKRAVSTSLHMSLDLERSSPMIRKSLMMEKMGDKDIIKRAFKTFQNRAYGSFNDEKSTPPKQVKSAASEAKISNPPPRKNGKEGVKNGVENISIRRNQSGNRSNPLDNTLSKSSAMDKRNKTGVSSTIRSFRSNERAEKRKENSEAKPVARAGERARISAKSKEEKESEIRNLRKSLNFKAKPLPSFYYKDQTKSQVNKKIVVT